jgi:hypothetical protein
VRPSTAPQIAHAAKKLHMQYQGGGPYAKTGRL